MDPEDHPVSFAAFQRYNIMIYEMNESVLV